MHKFKYLGFICAALFSFSGPVFSMPAFPGAEGFGSETPGGRGGKVIEVTNLNDSGPGSLRAALSASGPRIVVFRVAGTIELLSQINVTNPFLTVAGQTAPGGGITIKNHASNGRGPMKIATHDVVLRHLRIRSGPSTNDGGTMDGLGMYPAYNVVVDHCSFSWATDEVFQTGAAHDFTIQWSIVAEGLSYSTHPEGEHSKGMHFRQENSDNISAHHNLLAHNYDRNPNINTTGVVDVVNNVVYNASKWTEVKDKFGEPNVNIVNNYYKQGPSSESKGYEVFYYNSTGRQPKVFVKGNIGFHRPTDNLAQELIVRADSRWMIVNSRFSAPPVTTYSASEAFDRVLANAGATLPVRDAHDTRVANDTRNGTGRIIDDPAQVGGWLTMAKGTPPADTDHDGMPDSWEDTQGLNKNDPADGTKDADSDGYTNVEEYLNTHVVGGDPAPAPTPTPTPAPTPTDPGALTFRPIADVSVEASYPNNNYGSSSWLKADNSPVKDYLIKFDVSGIGAGQVTSAKLRLYNNNSSDKGGDFYRVANTWSEGTVTWNNAPTAGGTKLVSLGAVTSGNWYEVDVKPLITGDGVYSLRVQSTSTNGAGYTSKEAAGFAPNLVVTVGQ